MLKIGSFNELVVEKEVEFGLYLKSNEEEVLLPAKYVPENSQPGDTLNVFVYTDSEDRPVATTLKPKAVAGEFAYLAVKDVTPIGAFMDWGLEKDLLVPKSEQQDRMKSGKKYVLKVCLDRKTDRVYGTTRIAKNCDKAPDDLFEGKAVNLLIYDITKIGIMAVIDNRYCGMLYRSETYEPLAVGDERTGYVSRIREDGKIDLSLKKPGYQSISGSGEKVVEVLKQSGGFIACHDKSAPDEIRRIFAMSKKEFKRAVGSLYKKGEIKIERDGICLKSSD